MNDSTLSKRLFNARQELIKKSTEDNTLAINEYLAKGGKIMRIKKIGGLKMKPQMPKVTGNGRKIDNKFENKFFSQLNI